MALLNIEDYDFYKERYDLAFERIGEISKENILPENYNDYFGHISELLGHILTEAEGLLKEACKLETAKRMQKYMKEYTSDDYETSYLNPTYAVSKLGSENGGILSFLYTELTSLIPNLIEGDIENVVLFLELFIEVYSYLVAQVQEEHNSDFKQAYVVEEIKAIIYSFYLDNIEIFGEKATIDSVVPTNNYVYDILMNADLSNTDYLYGYGLPISENEIKLSQYIAKLSQDDIDAMAKVYVEGFVKGFEMTGRDMSIKDSVAFEYPIGMEAVVRSAVKMFAGHDLTAVVALDSIMSTGGGINRKRDAYTSGYNPQFVFDHKNDKGYYFTKEFYKRRLEVASEAYKKYKKEANTYAGPAVIEVFGEEDFDPKDKKENYRFTDKQNKWNVEFQSAMGELVNEYIPGDEYSFTIIAFPLPSIVHAVDREKLSQVNPDLAAQVEAGEMDSLYGKIFDETMELNTLDYNLYQTIQQHIIDALDQGVGVHITGRASVGNKTDLFVKLHELKDPSKETNFENCVADVNIPVGEVFTSPLLTGTNGTLHVKQVYLGDLQYDNLLFEIKDGKVTEYSCKNFEDPAENKKLIYENILFRHETLPMGECAIGTNTVAYTMARKYGIEKKLPILIAEKTGPHFAFGDTCYSHAEDVPMHNPDGKECIARDNECSLLRDTDMSKAYFNCHTDITIPYDELDKVQVVKADQSTIDIISEGRFVLAGTEKLNEALC